MLGVPDAGTENEPGFAAETKRDDLVARAVDYRLEVGGVLQLGFDELAATSAHATHVNPRRCSFGRQRRQPAVADAVTDAVLEDDFVEDSVIALVEAAGVEAKGCRREAGDTHVRHGPAQRGQ